MFGLLIAACGSSGIAAAYAGWLLQRLGASVTRTDNPAVDPSSPLGLAAEALSIGKLPPSKNTSLHSLLAKADILLCDLPIELIAAVGPLDGLASQYPNLTVAIHSIFGLTGPYAAVPAVALDAQAISAMAWALGDPLREPLTAITKRNNVTQPAPIHNRACFGCSII